MKLFDQILNAIDNPSQQASSQQITQILGTVHKISQTQGVNPQTAQTVVSIVGKYVRNSLREKQNNLGKNQIEEMVNKYSGLQANVEAVQAFLNPQQQKQIAEEACQKTGLDFSKIQAMLPILVPIVLNLLQTGASKMGGKTTQQNSVLNAFLDTNDDGEVDIASALSLASRFFR